MSDDTTQNGDAKDLVVTRIFDAPVERVWKAWSEPEAVREWWGPTGFRHPWSKRSTRWRRALRTPRRIRGHAMGVG